MRDGQNESALVCAARRGDKEALQVLLTCNWSWLKGLVYSVIGDAGEIDDVLQDICVRVITKIDSVSQPERFRPWLATLARRQALRHRQNRARRVGPVQPINDGRTSPRHNDGTSPALREYDATVRFAEDLERAELCEQILLAARSLPDKYREVFILQYAGDLTYRQTAEILDIPVTTVQIRLVRARAMIRDQVAGNESNKVREA